MMRPCASAASSGAAGFARLGDPRRVLSNLPMGLESDIVLQAIEALRAEAVLALPMHDGLIVPASAVERTCSMLRRAGRETGRAELRLKVDQHGVADRCAPTAQATLRDAPAATGLRPPSSCGGPRC
jgi:formate-dependent phosphoribosylglycinamide formyltransferase (GAR transformylase)